MCLPVALTLLSNLSHRCRDQGSSAANPPHWIPQIIPRCRGGYLPDSWSSIFVWKSKIMMRMGLIVVGLGTLAVMELGTPARTKTSAPDPFEQLLVDVNTSRDTLKTTDRLEFITCGMRRRFSRFRQSNQHGHRMWQPSFPNDSSSVENHHRGAGEKKDVVRKPKPKPKNADGSKPRSKPTSSGKATNTDRSKAVVELKPCRPNAFDSLLQALNLSSRCQS